MPANYYSIDQPLKSEMEVKKSKFITYLFPIQTEEEAQAHLAQVKKEHYKANHHCSAYILGQQSHIQRMSDDGEPSGTAGVPILEVLKKQHLTYILAIVVRYFGGVKLGAGGLIRAYSSATSQAIQEAALVQNIDQMLVSFTIPYSSLDQFQYYLSQTSLPITILDTKYLVDVTYDLAIHVEKVDLVHEQLVDHFSGNFQWEVIGQETINIPYNQLNEGD